MDWVEPIRMDELLDRTFADTEESPPEADGVYVVSAKPWQSKPTPDCEVLYVGGNVAPRAGSEKKARFRTRMGDLVADLFGFYTSQTGHHSGGYSLNQHCRANGINPRHLCIGWAKNCACHVCAEIEACCSLKPLLNKKSPARCKRHT